MGGRGRRRRLPIGAEVVSGGVHFRVWAPGKKQIEVVLEEGAGRSASQALESSEGGYHEGVIPSAKAGSLYRYRVDGEGPYPDPASRFQPDGPPGPSQVIDSRSFRWTDRKWTGPDLAGAVLYEVHVGTFTPEGTWDAAAEHLSSLAGLGVTVLEVMPVADFPGRFGWGYDGVNLFAPCRLYGDPDAMRRFVDRAHSVGLAVILDVSYSHLGPEGNYLAPFSPSYFSKRYRTEWGTSLNFDEADSGPVREYVLSNAGYWVSEFHLDGLRLDATQSLFDSSREHIIAAVARSAREAAVGRRVLMIGENESQDSTLLKTPDEGGYGLDAVWSDDFHHSAMVAATGRREGYYEDYLGTAQELLSACKRGYLWQGQWNDRQGKRRGFPALGVERSRFVAYLQNHDQLANSARGHRVDRITSPGHYRALTALLLLGTGTPFLFQGQEFASSSPFFYFGDLEPRIAELMYRGRKDFVTQFASLATPEMQDRVIRPDDAATFARSKLDHGERDRHGEAYALHADLLKVRRDHAAFRATGPGSVNGAVLAPEAFVLRFFGEQGDDRLLLVNLGPDWSPDPPSEPLLAPTSPGSTWGVIWSSEDPKYGGGGSPPITVDGVDCWRISGQSATVLAPRGRGSESR